MKSNRQFLAWLALGGCAFILSKGIVDMFLTQDSLNSGNPVTRLILAVCYSAVALVMIPYRRKAFFLMYRNWYLVALVLLALLSCLWAEVPGLVLQRSVAVLGTTLLGIGFATRLTLEEQVRLLSWLFRIMAALSLVCVLLFPSYGISSSVESVGNWQGIFGYKNVLGAMMAMCILVEWLRPANSLMSKFIKWLTVAVAAVLLVFSDSDTSVVALAATLLLIETFRFASQRLRMPLYAIIVVILMIVASGMTALLVDSQGVAGSLGRSSNFSGRTAIWRIVLSDISERPVLGYGYSGFWLGSTAESAAVDQAIGTSVMYAHNGYLETLLNLGAVGFLFTLAFLWMGLKRAYYYYERDRSSLNLWPLAFLTFFLLYNLGECTILFQDLQWALCVAVIASADGALFVRVAEREEEKVLWVPIDEPA
jgi:exopolysaccharide production protein ExoQ